MKDLIRFIDKIVILITILAIIFIGINMLYVETILNKKNVYRNQEQFEKFKTENELKILFFGDSLPVHQVNPSYIDGSFNLATPGESIEQTYYKVKWVLENEPSVEVYVLEYNYHLFNYHRINPYYDVSYWKNFMTYDELESVTNQSFATLYFQNIFPVIGKGEEIYKFITDHRESTVIENGWFRDDTIFPEDRENTTLVGETRAYNQFGGYPKEVMDNELVFRYLKTIELISNNNKTIVLVQYPLTDEYLRPLERDTNITERYSYVTNRLLKFKGVKILNYREKFRYNNTLFIDSDHLNTKGSEIFSKILSEDLLISSD